NGAHTSGTQLYPSQTLISSNGNNFDYNLYCTGSGCTASNNIAALIPDDVYPYSYPPTLNLSQWGTMIAGENRSIAADPSFVNPDGGDFHLQPNSPARGGGSGGVDMGIYPGGSTTAVPAAPANLRIVG